MRLLFALCNGPSSYQKNGRESIEIVRDQAVVKQYLRRKEEQKLQHYMNNPDLLVEKSGDAEENEIIKAACVSFSILFDPSLTPA